MTCTRSALTAGFILLVSTLVCHADDWPRWLGSNSDANWNEAGVIESIDESSPPPILWRTPVGHGYSGPAVSGDKVYLMDFVIAEGKVVNNPSGRAKLKGRERIRCFSLASGQELWNHSENREYFLSYPGGPRCTCTIGDGKVYALGPEGHLSCLDAASGKLLWQKNFLDDYGAKTPIWGHSAHPLLHGDSLYCIVGGEGSVAVAFDKDTGDEKWKALSAVEPGYCPPTMIEHNGDNQLIIWHPQAINSLDPGSGSVYWSLPLKPSFGMAIMSPRKSGDYLFASGIGRVGALIELGETTTSAEFAWRATPKQALFAANCTPYIWKDHIYGPDIDTSNLICARLSDGKRIWTDATAVVGQDPAPRGTRHGTAFLTRNTSNDLFYIFNEQGDLIIAELSPAGYEEKGRVNLVEPTNEAFGRPVVWSAPAFAERSILVRNDKELIRCDLSQ